MGDTEVKLVLYGSFNCPYSYLASLRVDRLRAAGAVAPEWRAVVHAPEVPEEGLPVVGELAEMFDREFEEIRGLLRPGEPYPARRPPIQPNTTAAVGGFYALQGEQAEVLRAALFDAYWVDGENIGRRDVLERRGCPVTSPDQKMRTRQAEWSGMERPMVPMLVLPDGTISRGLAALDRLAQMETEAGTWRHGSGGPVPGSPREGV